MVQLKTPEDIAYLVEGGHILAQILSELEARIAPGVTGNELEELAQQRMREANVVPAFLGYASGGHEPYPAALCISVNDGVVHGIPTDEPFQEGDIVNLDAGLIYKGKYYLDSARTVAVGVISAQAQELINVTKESLMVGIREAVVGATVGDIGYAIESYIEGYGLGVVTQLVGHGVGFGVHEEPQVPNFGKKGKGHVLQEGLVIAIEPMVTIGDPNVVTAEDGWTIVTRSGNLAAHFEHTVAVTSDGPKILTI